MVDFKLNNQHSTEVQTCSINWGGLTKIYINIFFSGLLVFFTWSARIFRNYQIVDLTIPKGFATSLVGFVFLA